MYQPRFPALIGKTGDNHLQVIMGLPITLSQFHAFPLVSVWFHMVRFSFLALTPRRGQEA